MKVILDGRKMTTRQEMHAHLADKLVLPAYYGKNLDALYDCLSEMRDLDIVVQYVGALRNQPGGGGQGLLAVLAQAAEENAGIRVRFE